MDRTSVFQRFCENAPFATMTQIVMRATIRNEFAAIFEAARGRQYEDTLTFEDFSVAVAGRRVDFRVSLTPTMNGQKLVIRVLDSLKPVARVW